MGTWAKLRDLWWAIGVWESLKAWWRGFPAPPKPAPPADPNGQQHDGGQG